MRKLKLQVTLQKRDTIIKGIFKNLLKVKIFEFLVRSRNVCTKIP